MSKIITASLLRLSNTVSGILQGLSSEWHSHHSLDGLPKVILADMPSTPATPAP